MWLCFNYVIIAHNPIIAFEKDYKCIHKILIVR